MVLLIFERFETNANVVTGGGDKFFGREQTVLRFCVAGSEDTGDAGTGRCRRHKEDGAVRTSGFGEGSIPSRVPHDSFGTDRLRAGTDISWPGASLTALTAFSKVRSLGKR